MTKPVFYATLDYKTVRFANLIKDDVAILLPASSFLGQPKAPKTIQLPPHITDTAADCGGFVATMKWGDYRYTVDEYVAWLNGWAPKWAASMDWCCEDEITKGTPGLVRERQRKTTEMARRSFDNYPAPSWAWVPTIQGWDVEDYVRHATEMAPLIAEMQEYYAELPSYSLEWIEDDTDGGDVEELTTPFDDYSERFRVGIGTLCRRASPEMIQEVVEACSKVLPGVEFHLWGVKLTYLQRAKNNPRVKSVDSAAWNGGFGSDLEIRRSEMAAMGLSQRKWAVTVQLPRYMAKVRAALDG